MQGLITKERKELDPSAAPFAKDLREIKGLMQGCLILQDFLGLYDDFWRFIGYNPTISIPFLMILRDKHYSSQQHNANTTIYETYQENPSGSGWRQTRKRGKQKEKQN